MNDFQMPGKDEKAEFVRTNFDIISGKYDLFNDLNTFFLHRLWKNTVASLVESSNKGKRITCMDLCCGTGDISLRLNKIPSSEKVFAVDFSDKMLDIARHRLTEFKECSVQQGDATALKNFSDSSMDAVTVGFGLRNVFDLPLALSEIKRVLKPGGIFINLDVGKVSYPVIRFFADFYFFKIVPLMGYVIWGGKNKMFDYLPVSSLHYPDQESLLGLLGEAGFENSYYKNYAFGNVAMHVGYKPLKS
jgi:demethylmenaquinone methyltransferase / 2-methoxy-6-polyprenyl-1,4-benzoquinol methylase